MQTIRGLLTALQGLHTCGIAHGAVTADSLYANASSAGRAGHAAMGSVPSDEPRSPSITTYIIAGVSGSGKSTVGKQLALRLDSEFFDGDDFHTPGNKGAPTPPKVNTSFSMVDDERQSFDVHCVLCSQDAFWAATDR